MTSPTPPHDERQERRLLAALLREPQLATEACLFHGITEADLYFHSHRLVWSAVWGLVESGAVPDLVSVWQVLVCRREVRELGPAPALWLADLYDADPTGAWCGWACEVVKWNGNRRRTIHAAKEAMADAYAGRMA